MIFSSLVAWGVLKIQTGLSDFHKIVLTVLKTSKKWIPRRKIHRDYHNFDSSECKSKLNEKLNQGIKDYEFRKNIRICMYAMHHSKFLLEII